MSDITKIRLLAMIEGELEQVRGMTSNENLWLLGSNTEEESQMHTENISNLEEYKTLLLKMKEQIEEDKFNV
jgi:hypothetical protein